MAVRLVAVGRVKNAHIRDSCEAYVGRIRRYVKIEIVDVRDAGRTDAAAASARRTEGAAILRSIPEGAVLVALSRAGAQETSVRFARRLERYLRDGRDVAFVIGGAHGLDERVLQGADFTLSLSEMTLPHEIARLALLEQVYRACTIMRGEPYHKGA